MKNIAFERRKRKALRESAESVSLCPEKAGAILNNVLKECGMRQLDEGEWKRIECKVTNKKL